MRSDLISPVLTMEPPPVRQVGLADKRKCWVWSQAELCGMLDFYDVRLSSTKGEEFPAHKLVLAMMSSYLKLRIKKTSEAVPTIVSRM